jgi:hypothetical protein
MVYNLHELLASLGLCLMEEFFVVAALSQRDEYIENHPLEIKPKPT